MSCCAVNAAPLSTCWFSFCVRWPFSFSSSGSWISQCCVCDAVLSSTTEPHRYETQHNWEGFHTWTALTRYTTARITSADLTHFGFTEVKLRSLYELHVFMWICNIKQTASFFKKENYYSEFNKYTEEKEKSNKMLMVTLKVTLKFKLVTSWVPVLREFSWIINISYIIQTSPTSITATSNNANNAFLNVITFIDFNDTNKM